MYACFIPHADKIRKLYIALYLLFKPKLLNQSYLFKDLLQVSEPEFLYKNVSS